MFTGTYFSYKIEIGDLQQLWPHVKGSDNKPHLKFPLEKFVETCEKFKSEDKMVDFMTVFESLVFHDAGDLAKKYSSGYYSFNVTWEKKHNRKL